MSLTSSLYAGTSGLSNTGSALQVTSNNISNINTLGFKKGTATFADTLYQTIGTNAGTSQVGLGMNVDNVAQVFTDGSLETTSNSTDLAIGGDGFFIVSASGSEETYYTRAGNFSFDQNGALVSSEGHNLQGWYVDGNSGDEYGAVTDLILTEFTSPPDDTNEITVITNLDSDTESFSTVLSNLFEYNEEDGTTMNSDGYEYQTVLNVYDSLGSSHEVTVYYDKQSDTDWEYVITCDPDEDKRVLVADTDSKGLLARGTISFSESSGKIVSMNMEEFTGVIGNVGISGNNTIEDVHFEIEDFEAIQSDGYGFEMSYNGTDWELDRGSLPAAYPDAEIILSNSTTIYIVLDPDSSGGLDEADLKISLDEYATSGDTLTFNVNDPTELHIQDIENVVYTGDANNNTTVSINNAGVMTTDAEDISIIWNPYTETWAWSNPEGALDEDTLISDLATSDTSEVIIDDPSLITIYNADTMTMVSDDVSLRYNNTIGSWDWNEALKEDDITATYDPALNSDPEINIVNPGNEGAIDSDGDIELTWEASTSTWSVLSSAGLAVSVVASDSNEDQVWVKVHSSDTTDTGASTIEFLFDESMSDSEDQLISFSIDPTPPAEYAEAVITAGTQGVIINFNGDSEDDVFIDVTDSLSPTPTTVTDGTTFSFGVNPDNPPDLYRNATLSGDATYCSIDLDGSGNEDDKEDIVFTFEEELIEHSTITFDIEGSTAWRTVTTDEAEETGYYQFTADFLGGEFGSTEADISFNIGSKFDGNNWINDSLSSTQYATSSSTTYQDADGYASGDLTGIEVDTDGLVTGSYSNGQGLALFKVALADFNNVNGLKSIGGNLYAATTDSGSAITNKPGENGLGTLSSYALEMSNVDISEEFVNMIELQTAYEANAKIITTVDQMMNTVIGMKQ